MPREHVIIECSEARGEGKPVSRYMTSRNRKLQPEKVEKMKYNKFLRRHTLHKEIKS
jgi:large subunit ribosomal protein L33